MSRGLRALKRLKVVIEINAKHWKQDIGYIEEELKAFEIIKKKHIAKYVIDTFEQDWNLIEVKGKDVTQEEYELLKEVLK